MIVAIQKKTLTYDFLLERGEFVMSAPTDKMMDVVVFAGYISGHEVDKWRRPSSPRWRRRKSPCR